MLITLAYMDSICVDERNAGLTYAGSVSNTKEGIPCQRWDSQTPHMHFQQTQFFPEKNLTQAENYCRNPDGEPMVWCYTMDASIRWKYCDVPLCGK